MPLKKDFTNFSLLACAGVDSLRNCVNEPELSVWLESIATERLGPAGVAPEGAEPAEPTRESKAREWLTKVARKHQIREGVSEEIGHGETLTPSSWSGLAWVHKALAEKRTLSRLLLPHEERERIASVLDWMRSDEGPSVSGDWTRISLEQAVKSEHDWIEARAKAFAKRKDDEEASQGTKLFLDVSSLGEKWAGWRWVKVESAVALDREGALMKHCVGSYAEDVAEGRKEIYSLRDPQDKPKLTVEARGPELAQLKGFANGACPVELQEAAGAFARAFEKVADPDALGLVTLSEDVEQAGFASLPGVGVVHVESGLSPEQRTRWERRLSNLAKRKGKVKGVECKELVTLLAKTGLLRELGELLPLVDPKVKHSEALSEAARAGHKAIVEMLLPVSDPKALDSEALRGAACAGHKEIVEMLLPVSDPKALDSAALREAAHAGRKEIVEILLPVSDPLAEDSKALRYAARCGHKEIVEMLLPVSDPLANNSHALRVAARDGYKEIVEVLLPVSDPLARSSEALRWAAQGGHKAIVEMLLPLSSPKANDSEALRWAAQGGHKEIVEMLLPVSDPLAGDSQALCEAARDGHKEIVEMLLPLSDPLARDSEALRLAATYGHKEIVQMLAYRYCGDENTFHHLLKQAGMDSSGFRFLPLGAGSEVQPTAKSMVEKIAGRRRKGLPPELDCERPVRSRGA